MSYNLFLDDCREPHKVTWVKLPLVEWVIVKSYKEFTEIIHRQGLPIRVALDHDLADEHYQGYYHSKKTGVIKYSVMKEKTGFDCAKWLVEYCMAHELDLPIYYVHTMNPIGKENIISLFESYKKSQNID